MNTIPYAPDIIKAMREWIADCSWRDIESEDVELLTESELVAGIKKHYAGGIEAFLETCKQ